MCLLMPVQPASSARLARRTGTTRCRCEFITATSLSHNLLRWCTASYRTHRIAGSAAIPHPPQTEGKLRRKDWMPCSDQQAIAACGGSRSHPRGAQRFHRDDTDRWIPEARHHRTGRERGCIPPATLSRTPVPGPFRSRAETYSARAHTRHTPSGRPREASRAGKSERPVLPLASPAIGGHVPDGRNAQQYPRSPAPAPCIRYPPRRLPSARASRPLDRGCGPS